MYDIIILVNIMLDKLKLYISENLEFDRASFNSSPFKALFSAEVSNSDMMCEEASYEVGSFKKMRSSNIEDFIDENKTENKFQKLLFKYIDDRDLKDSDVYNKVHIDRRLFSKIRGDSDYHPSKDTVILLGLSLKLNEDEIIDLLNSASYSLPKNNHYDLIIRFCFIEGIYELKDVNELLASYYCREFSY